MSQQERTFRDWNIDNVRFELGLIEKEQCDLLEDWLNTEEVIEDWERTVVNRLLKKATKLIDSWNESELQTKFIAHITELVDFDNFKYYFSAFSERKLETTYQYKGHNISLKGKVDWMVAIGRREPRTPFFFIHEYKKQEGSTNDTKGQLLATMLAAYLLNQKQNTQTPQSTLFHLFPKQDKDMPIYGCYIIGRWWYFVVLHKGFYCVSQYYDSMDKAKLYQIISILKKQKRMIIDRLKATKI